MIRTQLQRVLAVLSVAATFIGVAATPSTAAPVIWPVYTELVNRYSNQCLDVTDYSFEPGAPIQQWPCWDGPPQNWKVASIFEPNNATIEAMHSHLCLRVRNHTAGATVEQAPCNPGSLNQMWYRNILGGGFFEIRSTYSGLCLEVKDSSTYNGAPIILWPCWGGHNQHWRFGH